MIIKNFIKSSIFLSNIKENSKNINIIYSSLINFNREELNNQIFFLFNKIRSAGLNKNSRIIIVIPQGIEMAIACLAGLSCASIAPLNPNYTKKEFDFYFDDIKPSVLLTIDDLDGEAEKSAKERNIPILKIIKKRDGERLFFDIKNTEANSSYENYVFPNFGDKAILLHTSGTTSRPKLVPITFKNIIHSANNTIKALKLKKEDICLNTMPLFHVHGLMVAISSILAGGGVVFPPKFEKENFYENLKKYKPTWYTGGPTIHQEILSFAHRYRDLINNSKIRMIRSSSAPLSPETIKDLEKTFNAPVAESYGMTEAALQITSNELPPGIRKPGSVGKAIGLELKIVNKKGKVLPQGEIGEIIVRGGNIIKEYGNGKEVNRKSFFNKWFRTGDLGYLDEDNFLYIKGRIKEMINRGGQKISPREIDEAIMRNNNIKQAITFSMPHKNLGEEVAAAVIIKKGRKISEKELKFFLKDEIAEFKIPKKFFFVNSIPKGPTGKLKRIGLYEVLKDSNNKKGGKATGLEEKIMTIWRKVLDIDKIDLEDNFFELGGNSIKLTELILNMKKNNFKIKTEDVLNNPSIEKLSKFYGKNKKK